MNGNSQLHRSYSNILCASRKKSIDVLMAVVVTLKSGLLKPSTHHFERSSVIPIRPGRSIS